MRRLLPSVIPFLLVGSLTEDLRAQTLYCRDWGSTLVNNLDCSTARTFTVDRHDTEHGDYTFITEVRFTDANSSVTSFDMSCVVSKDIAAGSPVKLTPQSCDPAAGTCDSRDAVWKKPTPGSKNWPWYVNVFGYPDVECTITVAGTCAGGTDLMTVTGRFCRPF